MGDVSKQEKAFGTRENRNGRPKGNSFTWMASRLLRKKVTEPKKPNKKKANLLNGSFFFRQKNATNTKSEKKMNGSTKQSSRFSANDGSFSGSFTNLAFPPDPSSYKSKDSNQSFINRKKHKSKRNEKSAKKRTSFFKFSSNKSPKESIDLSDIRSLSLKSTELYRGGKLKENILGSSELRGLLLNMNDVQNESSKVDDKYMSGFLIPPEDRKSRAETEDEWNLDEENLDPFPPRNNSRASKESCHSKINF